MSAKNGAPRTRVGNEELRLAERVRSAVGERCITSFARTLDLNHESVRRYVRGMTSPPALFLLRLAERCEVDGHWLLTGSAAHAEHTLRTIETSRLTTELQRRVTLLMRSGLHAGAEFIDPAQRAAVLLTAMDGLAGERGGPVLSKTANGGETAGGEG